LRDEEESMNRVRLLLLAMVWFSPEGARAGMCDVVNLAAGPAEVRVAGKSINLERDAWLPLAECADLEVVAGPIQVRGLVGAKLIKNRCEAGPCALPASSKSTIPTSSSFRQVPGGHRMDKDVLRKAGMPKGEIYSVATAAQFDFSSLPGVASRFTLIEAKTKKPLLNTAVTDGAVRVPETLLQRGVKYAWEVYGAGNQKLASGGFDLMPEELANLVADELAALGQNGERSTAEKLLDELTVFHAHDLTYEIDMLRKTLGAVQ
jgi:hypothetical protein